MVSGTQPIEVAQQGQVAVVTFRGELDLEDSVEAALALHSALSDTSTAATLLDLSQLTFADSTLLNTTLRAIAAHQTAHRPLVVAGPLHNAIARLYAITGTLEILDPADSREDGLHRIRRLRTAHRPGFGGEKQD
ncbi:STAS domain-containing protein [Streptomyces sp. NPDC047123]|uniref:STAS domain-containing protein n=1 Tax=Streptomyces sp. NPDC047123 TaxID=3155622 RepID=UPI003400D73C